MMCCSLLSFFFLSVDEELAYHTVMQYDSRLSPVAPAATCFSSGSREVPALLSFLHCGSGVSSPGDVLC